MSENNMSFSAPTRKLRVVQHSFGSPGSGGPIGALIRVLDSDLAESIDFLHVAQTAPAGGISVKLIFRMFRQMRQFKPDLAHIRGLGNEGFHGAVAARLAGVPTVLVSVHGSVGDLSDKGWSIRRWIVRRILEPLTLQIATHVITVCRAALAKPLIKRFEKKVVGIVPNGVSVPSAPGSGRESKRRELGIPEEDLVLIIVARLVVDKGHHDLLQAVQMLPNAWEQRIHLLMVGDGPDETDIRKSAQHAGQVKIHMLGRRHDVRALMECADIAILPSWHENLSNALLEAMAAGLPVVATDVGGNTEVLTRGGGLLVPARDPSALASAITRLMTDTTGRLRMGSEARAIVRESYTVDHMSRGLADVYYATTKGNRKL